MIDIVYDVDDVLNNLNGYVFQQLKFPEPTNFNIRECKEYTKEQQDTILAMYGEAETFRNLTYVEGARDICEIEKTGKARVWINSSCFTQEIADIKTGSLLASIPGLNPERIILQIGLGHAKEPVNFAKFIVEDCLTNTFKYSNSTIKLLIDKVYNQAKTYRTSDWKAGITRVDNLVEANNIIRKYIENM